MGRPLLWLAASLDVEEEGLFGGKYACRAPSLRNTAFLSRLAPLLERGLRPTLFCTHCALTDAPTQAMLARLRDRHGAEIAAHLHFWNTPPLADGPDVLSRVPAAALGQGAFRAKLRQLLDAGAAFQGEALRSFRMGRWDLHRHHWPVLAEQGIQMIYDETHMVLAQGNYVLAVSEGTYGGAPTSYYDLWRVENGKIAEHWDVMETIADPFTWQNDNGKF